LKKDWDPNFKQVKPQHQVRYPPCQMMTTRAKRSTACERSAYTRNRRECLIRAKAPRTRKSSSTNGTCTSTGGGERRVVHRKKGKPARTPCWPARPNGLHLNRWQEKRGLYVRRIRIAVFLLFFGDFWLFHDPRFAQKGCSARARLSRDPAQKWRSVTWSCFGRGLAGAAGQKRSAFCRTASAPFRSMVGESPIPTPATIE